MEPNEKTAGAPEWVTVIRVLLPIYFVLEVCEVIKRADKIPPSGLLLRGSFAIVMLLGAIVLQWRHPEKRRATLPANDPRAESNDDDQLVGQPCEACGDRIVMESSGQRCHDCGVALHRRACATQHAKNAHPARAC